MEVTGWVACDLELGFTGTVQESAPEDGVEKTKVCVSVGPFAEAREISRSRATKPPGGATKGAVALAALAPIGAHWVPLATELNVDRSFMTPTMTPTPKCDELRTSTVPAF